MKRLSVVAPAYNEEAVIVQFYEALAKELDALDRYRSSMLFVVDGGTDRTFELLKNIAGKDGRVSVIKFSTNFGHQMALLAGIDHAEGEVIVTMDADLQHPPALIPELLQRYEEGSDIVYTVRETTDGVPRSRRAAGALFYRLFSLLSDVKMRENAADFRLLSRRAADVIKNDIRERALFLRGIISWMGFKQTAVPFSAGPRAAGESHYSLGKLVGFALTGAVSFSKKPLRFATFAGAVVAALGFLFALYTVLAYAAGNPFPPGWATVMVFLAIFSGIQLVVLGILGEYIGIVFDEVKARPHYVVEESINIEARTR